MNHTWRKKTYNILLLINRITRSINCLSHFSHTFSNIVLNDAMILYYMKVIQKKVIDLNNNLSINEIPT